MNQWRLKIYFLKNTAADLNMDKTEWCLLVNQKLVIVSGWKQVENCQSEEKKAILCAMNEWKDMKATLTVI